ncbi:MAG: hypothetical protein ACKVZ0_15315 [Gemmatimonadales bacterium]
MTTGEGVTGIDPASWRATILPLPKRFSRGTASGFCGGHPVGRAETARARSYGCWWPGGQPELLVLEGRTDVGAGRAAGDVIPGNWRDNDGGMGAVVWGLHDNRLVGTDLQDPSFARSWATAAGEGVVVGVGAPTGQPGQRARDVGLVWREGEPTAVVAAPGEVRLFATDGTRLAGSIQGRAALWTSVGAEPIDLAPASMSASEVDALDGDRQVGIAFKGMCARAALWNGTAASFSDLTPRGYQTSRAHDASGGFQVGYVRVKDNTRNGTGGSDNRSVLWQGAADRWFDLNSVLPAKYNASIAWAIEVRGDEVRVCGTANRFEVVEPGTAREYHVVPVAHPVLWTARLAPR